MPLKALFPLFFLLSFLTAIVQAQTFKYAFVTDTHIGTETGEADLRRTITDINEQKDIDFVVITGDVTEMGTYEEVQLAYRLLATLKIPYYIIPGNHDTGWSESGGVDFNNRFGDDKFTFDFQGYRFIACASGPYVRMSDGHIPRNAIVWLDSLLASTPKEMPLIFINHYPLDESLDNWYEAIDRLKKFNIQYIICGHGHRNKAYDFEGIPGTMGRSNLRAKDSIGGYNIVSMTKDTAFFSTRHPGANFLPPWQKIALKAFKNNEKSYPRPNYDLNATYPHVTPLWTYHSNANVVNTPTYTSSTVFFGNSLGFLEALNRKNGKKKWAFQTGGAIYSSPVIAQRQVLFGSADGHIYALNTRNGKLKWTYKTGHAVLGSPLVHNNVLYIGGSDGHFNALEVSTGKVLWRFRGVEGAIVGKPATDGSMIYFGSWGRHLYALDLKTGLLQWKWNNGSTNRMFSPAMCTPVIHQNMVYIVAPDRVLTAIDAKTGNTLWRNKEASVRESIGLSPNGNTIYAKTMQDEIVAYHSQPTDPGIAWRYQAGFGYDHVPSMLTEKENTLFFGTRLGVIYAIDLVKKETKWAHKIDHSMVNTVHVVDGRNVVASTMDGKVTWLQVR